MDKKVLMVIFIAAIVFTGAWLFMRPAPEPAAVITNFDECVAAGNPVMESFPPQCLTADGRLFIQEIEPVNGEGFIDDDAMRRVDPLEFDESLLAAVRLAAAEQAGVAEEEVATPLIEETLWPDACLGLADEDEMCAQVITPGFRITAEAGGINMNYRTNLDGSLLKLEE